jgi:hypothetical protein
VVGAAASEIGGNTRAFPSTITLDGYIFPVEIVSPIAQWRSGPQDTFRDSVVTAGTTGDDSLFSARGAWARYRYSWHHGAGQSLADLAEDADPYRWDSSYGLAWHNKYALTLQKATVNRRSIASANPVMCRSDIYCFVGDGTILYRTTDLITWTAMTAPGGTIQAMTSDGSDLYVATSTGVVKYVGAATVSTAFATPVVIGTDSIAFCSGRLLVGQANAIKELAAAGTYVSTIKTHYQAAFRWTTIFNIGSRIYIGGYAGSHSELHTLATDSTGNLVQSQEAAPLPAGEKLNGGIAFAGSGALLTSAGVRVASVSGDGTLTYGPLIDAPGDVRCATAEGRYLFTGWSSIVGARSGVARLVIDDEVRALQPAYGTDVFEAAVQGTVLGVARLGGLTAFVVGSSGIYVESVSTYAGQGVLESGSFTFGTVEPKGLVEMTVTFLPLSTGEAVELHMYDEAGTLIGHGSQSTASATELVADLNGEQVDSCTVRITLSGPGTTTPTIKRWRLRAYPVAPPVLQWVLPLIAKDRVIGGINEGVEMSMSLDEVNYWIEDLWESKRYTVLRIGERVYRVRVDNFEWRPDSWDGDGFGPQGLLVVMLVAT